MYQPHRFSPRRFSPAALLACCGVCLAILFMGGCSVQQPTSTPAKSASTVTLPTPTIALSTPTIAFPTPTVPSCTAAPTASTGNETLQALVNNQVPAGDWRDEAIRLKGIPDIPEVASTTPANYALGDEEDFYVINGDTREQRQFSARLVYVTQNVYFFVEQGVEVNEDDVSSLVDEFQEKTYPTNREFFGSEWIPGVDGDPHIYILYARGLGRFTQAYVDTASEFLRLAHEYSNEKEIIVLNADAGRLNDPYWSSTLAHEFQHMIHWYQNRNAETWMNEGASMLAMDINGFDPGTKMTFLKYPDLQLNSWVDLSSDPNEVGGHYDAAYLFFKYFYNRFGAKAIQALVASRATGITTVDSTLASLGISNPDTGQTMTTEDVFADWMVANFVNDSSLAQGQFGYTGFTERAPGPTDTIYECPSGLISASVHQFGTRYIELNCLGNLMISFAGSQTVPLVPTQPHGGNFAMWSSREDESDTSITRQFDLGGVSSATLDYWAWWQIESDYDFAYLEVSADRGKTWAILNTPSGTDSNPAGSNMGWGYTGCSGGGDTSAGCSAQWVHEQVDLSVYAGQSILVRFEYLTDAALNYPSLMLDDISVPEIDYYCNFESDACGWSSLGFVRVDNLLPQSFVVQLIHRSAGQTTIERMELDASLHGSLSLNLQRDETAFLAISGTTPFTTEKASFELEIK